MTLHEKIQKKAEGYGKLAPVFLEGAKFALENQWISVEDDLPCNHREYIDPEYKICTLQMLVKCKDGIYRLERMAILGGKWQWIGSGDDITHWMPIPKFK